MTHLSLSRFIARQAVQACALARVQHAEMQAKLGRLVTAEDTGLSEAEHDKKMA